MRSFLTLTCLLFWTGFCQAGEKGPSAIVITCVDPRYEEPAYLEKLPRGYHFTCAGASACLLEDEHYRLTLVRQVEALRKHGARIDTVIVIDHSTCKAYGEEDGMVRHQKNLRACAKLLHGSPTFKDCKVFLKIHNMSVNELIPVEEEKPAK